MSFQRNSLRNPFNRLLSPIFDSFWKAVRSGNVFSLYRLLVSPAIHSICGPSYGCRFVPTCSEYSAEAYRRHGKLRGSLLTLSRLSRCHPFARAGYDPIPHGIGQNVAQSLIKTLNSDPGR